MIDKIIISQIRTIFFIFSVSAEKLINLHTYYQVFHYEPKSVVEETPEHDPYAAQDSWQDADESQVKQKQVSSPSTKTLPPSS